MKPYRKGYRLERLAVQYMAEKYGAVCMRSAGSHSPIDLLCGNGREVYAVQVKGGSRRPRVDWEELEGFAAKFRATPLLLWKPDRAEFREIRRV